jgi:acyl-CoA synthetase (NDP forming)
MSRLARLLAPRSIAIVGGGAWCSNVVEQCEKIGFEGTIDIVHPTRDHIRGRAAVGRVEDLPQVPDAVFIGVNRHATVDVVGALSRMGAGGAICFASGFQEAAAELVDGADLQARLLVVAGDMPILGPNCYGLLNMLDGAALWPDQHGAVRCERGVAVITQSSNMAINLTMQRRALPLAYVVTAGNQAQVDLAELGMGLLEDPRVTALGLHIEGIPDLQAFEALAHRAFDLGKPIVVLKVGTSDQAQAATVSHTASLAGSVVGARALFGRLGIAQVRTLSGLLSALQILHIAGPLSSRRIASLSCSGGEASLMADTGLAWGLDFPSLNARQENALRKVLGPRVALANPLDYHTYIWGDEAAITACFTAVQDPALAMICVILDFPREDRCDASAWGAVIASAAKAQAAGGVPVAIVASIPDCMTEQWAQAIAAEGVIPLLGLAEASEGIAACANITAPGDPIWPVGTGAPATQLTEAESKTSLARYGLQVPFSARVTTPQQAATASADMKMPVVLKGEGLAHKTEAGAVITNLKSPAAVQAAAQNMTCNSFLVEEMVTAAVVELLVGITRDPAHGMILTLGAGGVLTEVLKDTVHAILPVTEDEVCVMLDRLRLAPLLRGYRGREAADRSAIVQSVMAVQAFAAHAGPALIEVEVNPLMCTAQSAIGVDALIILGKEDV